MKIVVIGTRGIPDIQGGVETHCQELFPRIAAKGHDVTVIRRSCYIPAGDHLKEYKGVKLVNVYAPRKKSLEAITHTFLAVIRARFMNPDVLHIHAIGPAIMAPFGRLLGMKVVMTHHGPDYDRGKWGRLAKTVLKTGEKWGARCSNRVIVISHVIADILATKHGRKDTALIFNGVPAPVKIPFTEYITSLGLKSRRYVVAVGRFVPEKNFHQLIEAFVASDLPAQGVKLAIAGDADHPDAYSQSLKELAASHADCVVLTGFIKGAPLQELLTHARLFCLPSSHEGLPISLLEAMSYGLDTLVSDIPANLIPELDHKADTFPVGDSEALCRALTRKWASDCPLPRSYDLTAYSWDHIACQTIELYSSLISD